MAIIIVIQSDIPSLTNTDEMPNAPDNLQYKNKYSTNKIKNNKNKTNKYKNKIASLG